MLAFYNEFKNKIKEIDKSFIHNFNVVNFSDKAIYIEGHCGIEKIDDNMLTIKVKNGSIQINGDNFKLQELTENTIFLKGNIRKMEFFSEIIK